MQDLSEAAKLIYDVDIQINSKEAAYMVYDHKLRVITDMPATLEECSSQRLRMERWKDLRKS